MQVETKNNETIQLPAIGHIIFGSDDGCGYVLNNNSGQPGKSCSVINDKSVCILEVFEAGKVLVNGRKISETAILHPGDIILIEDQYFKLIDENKLPKHCNFPFSMNSDDTKGGLISSVSGLRSYNKEDYGQLKIVGNKSSYSHIPVNSNDTPFYVSFIRNQLAILSKKGKNIEVNGNISQYATLKNGDYISTGEAKYRVESPGSSAFSKYSPSHPRNIQLSEEYILQDNDNPSTHSHFIKNNLWWMTLLAGLIVITFVIIILK